MASHFLNLNVRQVAMTVFDVKDIHFCVCGCVCRDCCTVVFLYSSNFIAAQLNDICDDLCPD